MAMLIKPESFMMKFFSSSWLSKSMGIAYFENTVDSSRGRKNAIAGKSPIISALI